MTKELKAIVEKVEGRLVAVASTEEKDRMGDIVKSDGWVLSDFKKNPVLLFAHRYSEPPIGIARNIKVEKKRLTFEPVFHELTQLAKEVKAMFLAEPPIMRAFSVGFIPLKIDEKDPHTILKQELLEISAVPVPANAGALSEISKSYTEDDEKKVKEWVDEECSTGIEEGEVEMKPYPGEHSCRLNSPGKYKRFRRNNCFRKSDGKCIDFIWGITKTTPEKTELQSMRYKKDVWTEGSARTHCKNAGGTFEPATKEEEKATYTCECLDCGYIFKTSKHCRDIKCPKCGGPTRRVERPGPGQRAEESKKEELRKEELKEKAVVPYHAYPKANEGIAWTGSAADVRLRKWAGGPSKDTINWKKYALGFCWYDSSEPEKFGSYKLPHHDIIGGGIKTVWRGVAAAMAVLLGARGGVDVPTGEKKGIYNHLAKHYKQFDKKVPEFREYSFDELLEIFGPILIESQIQHLQKEIVDLKAGRVISGKNRKVINDAIASMRLAIGALQDLLKVSESVESTESQKAKGRREEVRKSREDRIMLQALQRITKEVNKTKEYVKKTRK